MTEEPPLAPLPPAEEAPSLGVVGAGTMGAGLAATALLHHLPVVLCSRRPAEVVRPLVGRVLSRAREGAVVDDVLDRLRVTAEERDLAGCAVVVENLPEDLALKQALFQRLAALCPAPTALCSNTSVLGPDVFALVPEAELGRCALTHFFNPVPRMALVEVSPARAGREEGARAAAALAARLGKEVVWLPPMRGGIVSRLVLGAMNEAARLVADYGLAPEAVDRAARLGAGWPMGPLALADLVGIDVVRDNLQALWEAEGDERFRPHPRLAELVEQGRLGRKQGGGFHDLPAERRPAEA